MCLSCLLLDELRRRGVRDAEQLVEELSELSPVTLEELRGLEDGTVTEEELEQRLEERLERLSPGVEVDINEGTVQITTPDNSVDITID